MKIVLTIHGVGFLGGKGKAWQAAVSKVIAPHFYCQPLGYGHYRWFGLLAAVLELIVLLAGFTAILYSQFWHFSLGIAVWLQILATLALAHIGARVRRVLCKRFFIKQISSQARQYRYAHVIAHSMGTHLMGAAIEEGAVPFEALILTGCVLPTDYPWQNYRLKAVRVRNEVGKKDIVPLLAKILNAIGILPGFGASGRYGFDEDPTYVHTVTNPDLPCPQCRPNRTAFVHNIERQSGHSGTLDAAHAAFYWLPFLWDINTVEYSDWLWKCSLAAEHYENGRKRKLRMVEEELLASEWQWTNSLSLGDYIDDLVRLDKRRISFAIRGQVLRHAYLAVRAGLDVQQGSETTADGGWTIQLKWLHPEVALMHAVSKTLRTN
jgi:pimeloyl-ACP methyl ester carboxylesterase